MTSESQIRATFNDTKNAQIKLKKELDYLEEHNSIVKNIDIFFNLLADALLGMEYDKECKIYLEDGSVLVVNNLGKFIRHLSYCKGNVVDRKFFRDYNIVIKQKVNISFLWHRLKFEIFGVYPEALAMSIRISKEQTRYSGTDEVTSYDEIRGE
jgi:hypothetical protein